MALDYTLLTIGDGLGNADSGPDGLHRGRYHRHPGGLRVKHGTKNLGRRFKFRKTQALYLSAGSMFVLGLIPGVPTGRFRPVVEWASGLLVFREQVRMAEGQEEAQEPKGTGAHPAEQIGSLLHLDLLELEMGYGWIPLVDEERTGNLLERIRSISAARALEMGFIVSPTAGPGQLYS